MDQATAAALDPRVREILERSGLDYQALPCDPEHADTAVFCEHYGMPLEDSVNCIVVRAKSGTERFAACVLLAMTRLDVNRVVRKRLETRRISFASAEQTREITGMELGGVTPLALPADLPVWVDAQVMARERIILGGGNRSSKVYVSPRVFDRLPGATVVAGLAGQPDAR